MVRSAKTIELRNYIAVSNFYLGLFRNTNFIKFEFLNQQTSNRTKLGKEKKKSFITMLQITKLCAPISVFIGSSFVLLLFSLRCPLRFGIVRQIFLQFAVFVMAFAAMHSCYHVPLHNQNMVIVYEDGKKEQKNPCRTKKKRTK